ncbi:MAG: MBL fold metallo-hydrolase, partial [Clostridia bacterium]|nr:MBL fold metallo-hydrolase [Clostridia bacterium]
MNTNLWIGDRFLLLGGTAEEKDSVLNMQINDTTASLYVSHPAFDGMELGDRVHLSFVLTPMEDGGCGYALLMLTDDTDAEIDAALPAGKPSRIHVEGNLVMHEGKKAIRVGLCNYTGELLLEDLSADTDTIGDKTLLGGAKLTQFENYKGLMMAYAMQSDEGHLIMVDGGKVINAEMIYEFIKENGSVVDAWLLTHYHDDHINALTEILNTKTDIKIKDLYFNFPTDQEHIDKYGDSNNHCIPDLWEAIKKSNMVENVHVAHKGVNFRLGNLTVKVINEAHLTGTYDYVNNSS